MVYYDNTNNVWTLADADQTTTSEFPARGIAVESGTSGNPLKVLVHGWIRNDAWNWTAEGEDGALYLSDTPGGILSATAAATNLVTSGDCVQVVGWAVSADTIFFAPTVHWLEVE